MTTVERTNRWLCTFYLASVAALAGVYTQQPSIFLVSIIAIVYTAYSLLIPKPSADLTLSRTVSDETPEHGDSVTISVTVTNTGVRTITDLRLIDGVPSLLAVTDGTARHTTTLRPGGSTTFRYTVTAKHGVHRFEPATAIVHDISGSWRVRTDVDETDTSVDDLTCSIDVHTNGLRERTRRGTGPTADRYGTGIEFHQTRAYRRGDPVARIDWRRFARTGELTTVEFRDKHAAAVVLCLDARASAVRHTQPTEPHAVAYGVAAATELLSVFRKHGSRVGLVVFGSEFTWLAPDTGRHHWEQARRLLETHRQRSTRGIERGDTIDPSEQLRTFLRQSETTVEVLLFTPLLDDFGVTAVRRFEANGHAVTVIAPDGPTEDTLGGKLTRIERDNRIHSLECSGVPVCDWTPGDPIVWTTTERTVR